MFDIGFSELFVIAIVALLVLGPERLPKAARFAGLWVRRARAQWYSVKADLENELADDELKRSLLQARDQLQGEMRDLREGLHHGAQALAGEVALAGTTPESPVTAASAAADERAAGVNASAGAAAADAGPGMALPVGHHPAASMARESEAIASTTHQSVPSEGVPGEGRPGNPMQGDSAPAGGVDQAGPRRADPAGHNPPPDSPTAKADDDQR